MTAPIDLTPLNSGPRWWEGLPLLVQRSKEASDCVVCFDSHRSEDPSQMRWSFRAALGYMKGYSALTRAVSVFFGFGLQGETRCSLGWTHQYPPANAEVVGYFYEAWVFVLWLGWLILSAAYTKRCLPMLLPIRHSTSHTSISPAHTQPQLMDTARAQALMHPRPEVATGAHAARLIVMLNNSPHAGMLAHSELWPRFSGTAPWRTCRRTRSSAGL